MREWVRSALIVAMLVPVTALAAGTERTLPSRAVVPDRTILLLQQDLSALTSQDVVRYGSAEQGELLRQIAVATRASAQAQVEMLRQQNEIIRLLDRLAQAREAGR